jgi:hypothetical protein
MKNQLQSLKSQRASLWKKLAAIGPIVRGSIVQYSRRCGKPNCHCASGKRHVSTFLVLRIGNKNKNIYLQKNIQKLAKDWSDNYKKFSELTEQLSNTNIQILKAMASTYKDNSDS